MTEAVPLPAGCVDVAWSLGVLCVTPSRPQMLAELCRVLVPGGRLGLLVLQHGDAPLPEQPEGNRFPTHDALAAQLADAGFRVDDEVDAARLPGAPAGWDERAPTASPSTCAATTATSRPTAGPTSRGASWAASWGNAW